VSVLPDNNPKTHVGRLKPSLHAIPPSALIALGLAMENGEGKYGLMNWRHNEVASSVYYDAALRHLLAWWDGEDIASDSHIHHLGHVMACCAILIDAEIGNCRIDDRPVAGPTAAFIDHLHQQRIDAATQVAMARINAVAEPEDWPTAGMDVSRQPLPWWRKYFSRKLKEAQMPTELETIAAAVARSEASSEKTLALVQTLSTKLENIRATTNDPSTATQLMALAASLNAESDKVDAAEAAGEAAVADPGPTPADGSSDASGSTPTGAFDTTGSTDTTSSSADPGTTTSAPDPVDPGAPADPNMPSTPAPADATAAADPAPVADPTDATTAAADPES
jgi:hypothetical protein